VKLGLEGGATLPFLSIIIPVYAVQGYLRECLDSILDQSFTDIEVIAVDDSSPDHCPGILDHFAERDPRVRVIHLHHNLGNGPARNAGLDQATGRYVWFVDSDDRLAPGALRAVAAALRATGDPEVLLVDHSRVNALGEPGHGPPLPGRDDSTVRTVVDDPRLLSVFTVAWNKVLRRDFLRQTGIRFDTGWYEDIPFTHPVLVAATRIATLHRVCYHYRRRRHDAITSTRSERHFEVFQQWRRVFDRLDQLAFDQPGAGAAGERARAVREQLFRRMVWHLFVVQVMPDRLPARSRRAFFHQMSLHYHRYRPADFALPGNPRDRLRHRVLAADAYRLFTVLRALRRLAWRGRHTMAAALRRARSMSGAAVGRGKAVAGIAVYHLLRLLPTQPRLAVYAAYWYRGYACNPAAVYEKARELVPHVHGVWVVDRRHAATMPDGVAYVVTGSMRYYRTLARARWLVNNVNFPDFVVKRPGTTYLQTHHGTPVKVMGVDQNAYPIAAQGMDLARLLRRSDRWDFSLSSNAHSTEVWARAYPCRYQILEHGYPRNDRLARAAQPEGAADVATTRQRLGLPEDATVVLYAPTHREYVRGYRPPLDVEDFADAVGPDVIVLQRAHYFYGHHAKPGSAHPAVRDVSSHPVVEDLMVAADVLITDYSSVMFDYAVLDRPVVIYAPDWDSYVRVRGVTFDLLAEPPGVVATNRADLTDAFRTGSVWGDAATLARSQFRARFAYLDDGHAAERVVRRVFASELDPRADPAAYGPALELQRR
jgi:CDP-glycerol glycerophosphotransferase